MLSPALTKLQPLTVSPPENIVLPKVQTHDNYVYRDLLNRPVWIFQIDGIHYASVWKGRWEKFAYVKTLLAVGLFLSKCMPDADAFKFHIAHNDFHKYKIG